jgi:hypothetical protein
MLLVAIGGAAFGLCGWALWFLAYLVFWFLSYRHADRRVREAEEVWAEGSGQR